VGERANVAARRTAALILTACFVAGAWSSALAQPKTLTAGTITNSPPLVAYATDGTTLQGMIVDLAAAMSKQSGTTIAFTGMPFPGLLPALEAKRIDIVFTLMNDTPEREKTVDFVDFFTLTTTLLVKKGNPDGVAGLESLCGKSVSTVQGSTQVALVDSASASCTTAGKPAIANMQYAQPAEARLQVQSGRVSAFLGNTPVLLYLAKTAGNGTLFDVVRTKEYDPLPLGIAVPKSEPQLRDALQKSLNALIADGTYRKVLAQYGVESGAVTTATVNGAKNVKM